MDDSTAQHNAPQADQRTPTGFPARVQDLLLPEIRQLLDQFQLGNVGSHLLRRAHFVAEDIFAQEFHDEAITPRQKAALIIIYQHPGANQNALADLLFMDRNTVAELTKRLVGMRLIHREKAPDDRRAYRLHLAPAGAQLLNRVMLRDALVERQLLERLPEELRLLFIKCLKMLVNTANRH